MGTMLTLLPHTTIKFHEEWRGAIPPNVFAIALIETPQMPGERHPESNPLALVCAGYYACSESERAGEKLWGWMLLADVEDKRLIGDTLVEAGAQVGRWYYMEIL